MITSYEIREFDAGFGVVFIDEYGLSIGCSGSEPFGTEAEAKEWAEDAMASAPDAD